MPADLAGRDFSQELGEHGRRPSGAPRPDGEGVDGASTSSMIAAARASGVSWS